MIIKNIYHKIHCHPFFYLVAFVTLVTGNFKDFSIFMSLLIIHELGHILMGYHLKWNIKRVIIFPFGALTIFEDHLNKPIREEFFIVIAGPIFQCLFYQFLSHYSIPHLASFHYGLLLFNLLPMIPLDGSKMVVLIYQRFFSYWGSQYFIFFVSLFSFPLLFWIMDPSFVLLLVAIILLQKIVTTFKKRHSLFSKFTLERFLYPLQLFRRKVICGKNIHKMRRDTKHLFLVDGIYYTEQQMLQKVFDFKKNQW